jgi:hypothetical protein
MRAITAGLDRKMSDNKWREALIEYMVSVSVCDGGEYGINVVTKCLEPLTKEETEILLKEVDERTNKFWQSG